MSLTLVFPSETQMLRGVDGACVEPRDGLQMLTVSVNNCRHKRH